jgi:hypothetical protein
MDQTVAASAFLAFPALARTSRPDPIVNVLALELPKSSDAMRG